MMKMNNMFSSKNYFAQPASPMIIGSARGFTLLELLIAVLIGSIVIAVVGSLFLANSNTFRAVDDSARLQENGRFALQAIARSVRQAGFIPADVAQLITGPQDDAYPTGLAAIPDARIIAGTDGAGAQAGSDTLTVAFRGSADGQIVDCAGRPHARAPEPLGTAASALPAPITNMFYVAAGAEGGFSLWCDVTVNGAAAVRFELITGVESFQVLYAVDVVTPSPTGGPGARDYAADYVTSANNLTGTNFNNVLGVQVALVLRGAESTTLDKTNSKTSLNLFGTDTDGTTPLYNGSVNGDPGAIYSIPTSDTKRTFRVITSTINLRNRSA
jgi:type IV pilus assembly protein PilW